MMFALHTDTTATTTTALTATQVWQLLLGGILILLAAILVVIILKQTGKDQGLSGTLSGGSSETYFGKSKGASKDKILSIATIVCSSLFVVLLIVLTIFVSVGHTH